MLKEKPLSLSLSFSLSSDTRTFLLRPEWNKSGELERGLFPSVFNLASDAHIESNATCGQKEAEVYCKLVEHVYVRPPQCGICDDGDEERRHPITNAIDGTNSWWQSPTLQNGPEFQWVTITIDLKQVFQVAYVIIKSGISPRPGNWILERSIDGVDFSAWQFYALSDGECQSRYAMEPRQGNPTYRADAEVICTSFYSKLNPLENGEIHTSLINGRPGASGPSAELLNFTLARYVRLRLQKLRTLNADLMNAKPARNGDPDRSLYRRLFYSIKDISIGGQCVCNGHADTCSYNAKLKRSTCQCEHNTCGDLCDRCCPLFNQRRWSPGTSEDGAVCQQCQCYGHANECHYDALVERDRRSLNTNNAYQGGGVCTNCSGFTMGINCEQCLDGYYRPQGAPLTSPCIPCGCHSEGSVGHCVKGSSATVGAALGEPIAGQCICRQGFDHLKCDRCASGFSNFPHCQPCQCHTPGISDPTCSTPCRCKVNVEGDTCGRCRNGFFNLQEDNGDGCSRCFCFDRSGECTSADLGIQKIETMEGWLVTDLLGRRVVSPYAENDQLFIANDDMTDFTSYYWLAPDDYLGKKLTCYSQWLAVHVSWVNARGDTGGSATSGPDIVLEGSGMKIAYGDRTYPGQTNTTMRVKLVESNWYHLADGISDISRKRRTEYRGDDVTQHQFFTVLNNVNRFMVRAKFHTDQIEGGLYQVQLHYGSHTSLGGQRTHGVEQCVCPAGYTGLSCEQCAFGYVRVDQIRGHFECLACNCSGHAATCDLHSGRCSACLDNTAGDQCQFCAAGYYGNATHPHREPQEACTKCRCPLDTPSNQFSPTCVATGADSYYCDRCPPGYEGQHCQRCSDGYFGDPSVIGGSCQRCHCNNNQEVGASGWCDRLTGHCLKCKATVSGQACEQCHSGYYGNALQDTCKSCRCYAEGSTSHQCDKVTGQCHCKDRFMGQRCDRCKEGYGNVASGCRNCHCDLIGSLTPESCDGVTGQCQCKPGVGGQTCNECLEHHYGFSIHGCQGCACHDFGSKARHCDIITGQCTCRPNVTGLKCDQCQVGHWNLQSGKGCKSCQCDVVGSLNGACDSVTGACTCRPGVGGPTCDACLPAFFSFSSTGCKECDVCDRAGHVCDADTGRCVCPPWTEGDRCQNCAAAAWNYHPLKGCTSCNCNSHGSTSNQCDRSSGTCRCRPGFAGATCDRCASGHYAFPQCHRCDCDLSGSSQCPGAQCGQCHPTSGQCPCKKHAVGRTCSTCRPATFGLDADNSDACTPCFCFGRTSSCSRGHFVWTSVRMDAERGLTINYDHPLRPPNAIGANQFPVNTQEICYINLALPGDVELKFKPGETQLNVTNNLRIIPDVHGDVMIGVSQSFDTPLYWKLPPFFLGDRILSYNGHLRFSVTSQGGTTFFPNNILATYPLVQIQGNRRLVLEYYPKSINADGHYHVRLHERLWRVKNNPRGVVTREMMMVALQHVQHVLIRATDSMDCNKARLSQVSLDVATPAATTVNSASLAPARGIEVCQCPGSYAATSCQDPNIGFWRHFKSDYITSTIIIDLVGQAKPCRCNGRSETCHKETGYCTNCRENTSGDSCNVCAAGFHGDPARGQPCRPCPCPSVEVNHADSCQFTGAQRQVKCACSRGYRGERCDRCDYGFYGDGRQGQCRACRCDPHGSVSDECDEITGQCNCKPGITGRDCTYCAPRHVISPSGCKSCQDGCTGDLFDSIDAMSASTQHLNVSDYVPLPWTTLLRHENSTTTWQRRFEHSAAIWQVQERLISAPDLLPLAQLTLQTAKQSETLAQTIEIDAAVTQPESAQLLVQFRQFETILRDVVAYLKNYAIGETPSMNVDKAMAQIESHWNYIQSINTSARASSALLELERSEQLMDSVRNLYNSNPAEAAILIRDHLDGFQIRLEDLQFHVDQSHNSTETATATLKIIDAMLSDIRQTIQRITEASERCEMNLNSASIRNINASMALTNCRVTYQSLTSLLVVMTTRMTQCSYKRTELTRLNPELRMDYVIRAQKHADHLLHLVQTIVNRFSATRDVADLPLQAANAYASIVEALRLSRQAALDADEAAETAYTQAYPNDLDVSLLSRARLSRKKSAELLSQSEQLQASVSQHQQQLKGEQSLLDQLESKLSTASTVNEESNIVMDKLPRVRDRVKAAVEKSMDALMTSTTLSQSIDDVSRLVETKVFTKLNSIKSNQNVALGNIPKLVEDSRKKMKMAEAKILQLTKKNFQLRTANNSIHLKLDELRNKILRAKQAASSIRVSLSGNGNCHRTLRPTTLQPSSQSTISLTYAFNKDHRDSLLFYLPAGSKPAGNDKDVDFLAAEMVDRKIRFIWNVGGGTQVLTHPLRLLPSPHHLTDDSRWYHIQATRMGNVATLDVRPVKDDAGSAGSTSVTATSAARFTKLDLTTGDRIHIGILPPNPSPDVKTSKFYGHLHQLWFDGQPLGLWNFATSSNGCAPSIEGAQRAMDESSYRFNGMGYAQLAQIPRYDPRQYSVTFSFRSLDENALLFLAIDEKEAQFISLELTEGFVRYEVRYGANYEMSLQSRRKYNTGDWIKVEASRVLIRGVETALLKVADDEELSAAPFHLDVPDLLLEDARLYIGGLPPDVDIPKRLMNAVPGSFLGCMKDLQVVAFGMNPLQGSFYGVEASCSSASDKIAAFHGHGFLQLRSSSHPPVGAPPESSVAFTFQTRSSDAVLLYVLPTSYDFEEQPSNSIDDNSNAPSTPGGKEGHVLSVAIRSGKLEARFRSSEKVLSISSKETFNDGLFHNVVVIRNGRKVELLVDDVLVGTQRFRSGSNAPDHFHLMVGGIRPELTHYAAAFIGTHKSFIGCIADIAFNNELIDMSHPVKHSGVAVGRCHHVPSARNLEERMQASEKALSSCRQVPQYTIEGRAFKFGDVPYSHVMLPTQRSSDPDSGFNVTLDFRTHYPNGLLLYSMVKRKKSSEWLVVALKNGRLVVSLRGKKKEHQLSSSAAVNDGHWHKMDLLKVKRAVTLVVDKETRRTKAAKLFKLDHSIYVGGLPESDAASYSHDGFKGCIRDVHVNGMARDLASSDNVIHRVGQCFAHVETGSYFPGDAYAVYSSDFRVGPMADIQLEFRTTELNGVLLSVSEKKGSASLSLYIDDGSMVFAVDMGHNVTFAVRQSMASAYQLCDNRWHSVKANYVENALTLKVDTMDEQYAFSSSGHVVETTTPHPLYIGGIPDLEPQGALAVRDNFKGCIRNVVIRGEIKDWTDMALLNNVLLNACPIQ